MPGRAAQAVQLDPVPLRAITGQKVDVFNRQVEFCVPAVLKLQAIMGRALDVQGAKAFVTTDAVVNVDDQVSGRQGRGLS